MRNKTNHKKLKITKQNEKSKSLTKLKQDKTKQKEYQEQKDP